MRETVRGAETEADIRRITGSSAYRIVNRTVRNKVGW